MSFITEEEHSLSKESKISSCKLTGIAVCWPAEFKLACLAHHWLRLLSVLSASSENTSLHMHAFEESLLHLIYVSFPCTYIFQLVKFLSFFFFLKTHSELFYSKEKVKASWVLPLLSYLREEILVVPHDLIIHPPGFPGVFGNLGKSLLKVR